MKNIEETDARCTCRSEIGNILMVAVFQLSDHDVHEVASIFFSGGFSKGWLLWNHGEVLK
jgi:hypothetical protein